MQIIYHYDANTSEFVGATNANKHPFNDTWVIPANSTDVEPPTTGENETAIFDKISNSWSKVADFRNSEYWLPDGTNLVINRLAELIPENALFEAPDVRTPEEKRDELKNIANNESIKHQMSLVSAIDAAHLNQIIMNGTREAVRLLKIKNDREWNQNEASRAAELDQFEDAITALEASASSIIADIRSDTITTEAEIISDPRWP